MSANIFVNLPVKDLDKSVAFFTELGFSLNQQCTDENATGMIVSDDISVMLLVEPFFQSFTTKKVADTATTTETITSLGLDSRQQVDELADKALAAGGQPANDPMDESCMYVRSFQDLDGHVWELMYMDPAAMQE